MIVDLHDYDGPSEISCDLCIVGAGAAGLSVALQFVGRNQKVVVLEGGGFDYSEESQNIYRGSNIGRPYHELDQTRLRYLGGSTNHWAGWCRPLDPEDFQHKPWVPYSGWPINQTDLAPYLMPACEILDLGEPEFRPQANIPSHGSYLPFNPNLLVHRIWRSSYPRTRFKDKYHEVLRHADNVHVFLHANVNDIALSEDYRQVRNVRVVGPGNKKRNLFAQAYVLALGGLETPRLLLNANTQIASGIGNQHDLVGRFFMEHPEGPSARIVLRNSRIFGEPYQWFSRGVIAGIGVNEQIQERLQLLNHCMTLEEKDEAVLPGSFALASDVQDVMREVVQEESQPSLEDLEQPSKILDVHARSEQTPNPDSRVQLSEEMDGLGLRRITLNWRLTELDQHTIRVATELLGKEMGRLGIGRMWLPDWLYSESPLWSYPLWGANHHMGTTRMADDPQTGVVDKHCRIHGLENLFIAGSSVFPTSGSANPTLTITQLALRLADHLKQRV